MNTEVSDTCNQECSPVIRSYSFGCASQVKSVWRVAEGYGLSAVILTLMLMNSACDKAARRIAATFGPESPASSKEPDQAGAGQADREKGAERVGFSPEERAEAKKIWSASRQWIQDQERGRCAIQVQSHYRGQSESIQARVGQSDRGVNLRLKGRWRGELVSVYIRGVFGAGLLETRYGEQSSASMRKISAESYASLWTQIWSNEAGPIVFALRLAEGSAGQESQKPPENPVKWSLQGMKPAGKFISLEWQADQADQDAKLEVTLDRQKHWPRTRRRSTKDAEGQRLVHEESYDCR